jgi:hypothetical protein
MLDKRNSFPYICPDFSLNTHGQSSLLSQTVCFYVNVSIEYCLFTFVKDTHSQILRAAILVYIATLWSWFNKKNWKILDAFAFIRTDSKMSFSPF